jgi:hypothetical protein
MAIKGLTDTASVAPRWSRLGKLRKGAPKPEKGPGRELPYWRFTAEGRNAAAIEQAFAAKFGKEPVAVEVFLMAATPDEAFPSWMEFWKASSLERRCDGETCHLRRVGAHMVREAVPCICATEKLPKQNCVKVGRLAVVIPALIEAGYIGEVVVETHSGDDLRTLAARLSVVYQTALQYGGDLRGVPFILSREPVKMSTPRDNGERVSATKYQVRLEPAQAWTARAIEQTRASSMALASGERLAIAAPEAVAALPAPRTIDQATGEIRMPASEINFGEDGDVDLGEPPQVVEAKPAPQASGKLTLQQAYDQLIEQARVLGVKHTPPAQRTVAAVGSANRQLKAQLVIQAEIVAKQAGIPCPDDDDKAIEMAVKLAKAKK